MNIKKNNTVPDRSPLQKQGARGLKAVILASLLVNVGCALTSTKSESTEAKQTELHRQNEPLNVSKTIEPVSTPTIADTFIERAENLFSKGQFFSPKNENAYMFYRAAQMLEPDHAAANAGLDALLIAESNNISSLLEQSKMRLAEARYQKLNELFPGNTLLVKLKTSILAEKAARVRREREQVVLAKADESKLSLDERELELRSDLIVKTLAEVAERLVETKEGVLIFAHSDADARWVYQQMRKAAPGYRIRGDLRRGKPAIKFLSPFD